jgi:hypothetical protein
MPRAAGGASGRRGWIADDRIIRIPRVMTANEVVFIAAGREGEVELEGTSLLMTLATVMVTFAGFAALVLSIRQSIGAKLSLLDQLLAKTLVTHLFLLTAGAFFPSLLTLYGVPELWVWKIAAVLFAVPLLIFLATYPRRRRKIAGPVRPILFVVYIALGSIVLIATLIYVWSGLPYEEAAYVTGLIASLGTLSFSFVAALDVILRQPGDESQDV